ncbi:hypothetical protein [Roseomonas genomospecies 6]|uniref:Uncharacterized protein n=1 Tax=Roseomonas genomospecies 6 TaxID=214106 RepID=A0A9W7NMQ9_9PROT|nr:hypothetical protein [Roseomonas genomospecies 6]KAA0683283.1 hypothetical protein DS843_02490 [Roseomonas genomospecies 6]
MAQILAFPGKTQTGNAAHHHASSQIESATADFDRMMAHHSELQRQMAEFNRLCEQALAERPMAELLYHPTACGGEVCRA